MGADSGQHNGLQRWRASPEGHSGIGFLFGRQKAVKTREEVIMLIQPYVLESDADAREVTEKLRAMLSKTLACSDRPGACRME